MSSRGLLLAVLSLIAAIGAASSCGESVRVDDGVRTVAMAGAVPVRFASSAELERPKGYRSWVYVGSPLTPNDMNDGKAAFPEFHSVYIDPKSYDAYKRTGRWRDGTILVKELVSVGSKAASSGKGYFMGEFLGVEVALKSAERFPDEPGNWGYFRFTDENGGPPHATATPMATESCASCHNATADDDLVFTQYYPVLRAAKKVGEKVPEDR